MRFFIPFLLSSVLLFSCGEQTSKPVEPDVSQEAKPELVLPEVPAPDRVWNVALLITDGVFNTELTAPMDIFHHTKFRGENHLKVYTIAETLDPIVSYEGLKILPDYAYSNMDSLPPVDVLVVPSAENHLGSDLEDTLMLNYVKWAAGQSQYVTSHCDGAFLLAKAGVLDGHECTTFPSDIDAFMEMFPELTVHKNTLFVHDGKVITSAGGAKSFEAALYLHHLLFGKEATEKTAEGMVIDWDVNDVNCVIVR